jgi:vancomycin permeability regulator SanA
MSLAPPTLIALFGAAVWPGGRASPSLARRIRFAAQAAEAEPGAMLLCSGGVGRHPPSEASVMARELAAMGVAVERLILDDVSLDTFDSVALVARRARGVAEVVVCSDGYHIPRIRLMLALLGVRTRAGPCDERPVLSNRLRMSLREALAIPYDATLVILRRRRILSGL